MTDLTVANFGSVPGELIADASCFSEPAIRAVKERGIDVYCPPERGKMAEQEACPRGRPPLDETFTQRMKRKVRSEAGRVHDGRRKYIVKPLFGRINQGRGRRQLLTRGVEKGRGVWRVWALTHNLSKIYRAELV
ncbi:MAG: transposase [Thermoplasmata archaeon]